LPKPLILNKPVIGITGSAGKTTTKEMLASILQKKWRIYKTYGNANDYQHTKKAVEKILPKHKAAVLEFGMFYSGGIRKHCSIIQPNIGIITNVGTAHIGNFNGQIKGVALAKSELIHNMKQTGLLVINGDDTNSRLLTTKGFKGKIFTVGIKNKTTYQAFNIKYAKKGMSFQVVVRGQIYTFFIPVFGKHNIYNALSAIAVADHLNFSPNDMINGLKSFVRPNQRLSVHNLKNNIKVIDDTFSANPNAMKAAIDVLDQIGEGKKIAVLGTMLEMGKYAVKGHKDVGKYVARKKIDNLITFGVGAEKIGEGAIEAGFNKNKIRHFTDRKKLNSFLISQLSPNVSILIKASHRLNMNQTVKYILKYLKSH